MVALLGSVCPRPKSFGPGLGRTMMLGVAATLLALGCREAGPPPDWLVVSKDTFLRSEVSGQGERIRAYSVIYTTVDGQREAIGWRAGSRQIFGCWEGLDVGDLIPLGCRTGEF